MRVTHRHEPATVKIGPKIHDLISREWFRVLTARCSCGAVGKKRLERGARFEWRKGS